MAVYIGGGVIGADHSDGMGGVAMKSSDEKGVTKSRFPTLASGTYMMVSWTLTVFIGVIGFSVGLNIFPSAVDAFSHGNITASAIAVIAIAFSSVLIGQLALWQIFKKGWEKNGSISRR